MRADMKVRANAETPLDVETRRVSGAEGIGVCAGRNICSSKLTVWRISADK